MPDLLAQSLARTTSRSLKLVVLDTCASMKQAKVLVMLGVPYAIGIYDDIVDDVATDFYTRFYSQIGSGGDLKLAGRRGLRRRRPGRSSPTRRQGSRSSRSSNNPSSRRSIFRGWSVAMNSIPSQGAVRVTIG